MKLRHLLLLGLTIALAQLFTAAIDNTAARANQPPLAVHTVSVVGGSARAGNQFVVGIELESGGDEAAASFTLNFDPTKLSISNISHPGLNPDVALGTGIPSTGATIVVNANHAPSGRIGIVISSGSLFSASPPNRQFVRFRFTIAANAPVGPTDLTFGNSPTPKSFSDGFGNLIVMTWVGGTINIEPATQLAFEGDVAPRTTGDEAALSVDVVQMRRFATGLDTPSNSEFQRADTAPRATLGDGVINASDVVQARRYSAGLDPMTNSGGPTGPPASARGKPRP